jgi:hypothetical protein
VCMMKLAIEPAINPIMIYQMRCNMDRGPRLGKYKQNEYERSGRSTSLRD